MAAKQQMSTTDRVVSAFSKGGTITSLLVLVVLFSILKSDTFPTSANVVTILSQSAVLAMIAGGLTIVLVMGDFDLSIGFVATLTGVLVCNLMTNGMAIAPAILIALLAGVAVGVLNGTIVAYWKINAFIATLGTGAILGGVILWLSNGGEAQQVPETAQTFFDIGQSKWIGIPMPVFIGAVVLLALWFLLNKTELGRRMDATGGNPDAARLSGIRTARCRFLGFVISGLCSGIAGIVLAAELGAGYSDAGTIFLLQAFTACFLGAVTLRDNEFHILGTVVGVLILTVAFNGLAQLGVETYWQDIAQGAILIFAVSITLMTDRVQHLISLRRVRGRARTPTVQPPSDGGAVVGGG